MTTPSREPQSATDEGDEDVVGEDDEDKAEELYYGVLMLYSPNVLPCEAVVLRPRDVPKMQRKLDASLAVTIGMQGPKGFTYVSVIRFHDYKLSIKETLTTLDSICKKSEDEICHEDKIPYSTTRYYIFCPTEYYGHI